MKAISVHIGLNRVDPNHYQDAEGKPWEGILKGCHNDANAMHQIAEGLGYHTTKLLDDEATADRIIAEIGQAAWNLDADGIFLLTFAGHGGRIRDVNGDEDDGMDETWCAYDRQLIDDELSNLWDQFPAGARILMISDSCHSGTVTRNREYQALAQSSAMASRYRTRSAEPLFRAAPLGVCTADYERNKERYDALQYASGSRTRGTSGASVLLISGCMDNQQSGDGEVNGLFTETLLKVWDSGAFEGNYRAFRNAISEQMPSTQTPNYYMTGAANSEFEGQKPFTVDAREAPGRIPAAPAGPWPMIKAEPKAARAGQPPQFSINAGPGRFYAVEIAADRRLFDGVSGVSRRDDNYFGSWEGATELLQGDRFVLPVPAWERLRNNGELYYRLLSTSSRTDWTDCRISNSGTDAVSTPRILVEA